MIRKIIEAFSRLLAVFHKRKLDEEFDEELAAHIDLLTEENKRRGMSPVEARRQAVWRIGGVNAAREIQREARGLPRVENVVRAVWQAWRSWRSAKTVAVFAAVALAVGIGATTSIYTVVHAVMLKPLAYRDGDRFVALFGAATNDPEHYSDLSYKDARTYQDRTRVFDAFGWFREAGKNLVFAGEPLHVEGAAVTTSLVHQLGVDPAIGRWFQDQDEVVISNSLWRRLGSDPGIVGKALTLDGRTYSVTGVMPAKFHLPVGAVTVAGFGAEVWMPLDPKESGGGFFAYARRKPGVSFVAAESDVKRVAAEIAAEDPAHHHPEYTARLFDLRETVIKDIRSTLLLLFAAAGLLFLITCANTAGLLLARSVARAKETAIRVALGPGRGHLALHYFAEGFIVALAGAAGGVLLTVTMTPAIVSMASEYLPRADEVAVDWTVLLFAFAGAFVASVLSSLAPLWQAARTSPADVLADGVRSTAGVRTRRLSQSLVVAEIALAFGLLAISAVLIFHLRSLSRMPFGFDADHVLTFTLSVPGTSVDSDQKRFTLHKRLIEALRTVPGVEEIAISNQLPLNGCCVGSSVYPDGRAPDPAVSQRMSLMAVSPGYFRAMRIPLRSGRLLNDHDLPEDRILVVIDQAAAKRYWGDDNPVGAFGRFDGPKGDRFQVIGVVGDVKNDGLNYPTVPEFYIQSFIYRKESMNFVVRSDRAVSSLLPEIRRIIRGIDPEQPITDVTTMREIIEQTMTLERVESVITGFFAATALLLAMLGIYGIVSYSVRQRTVEIGTRMALGAGGPGVLALIVGGGLKMAAYGIAAGGLASIGVASFLGRVLNFGQPEAEPFLYSTAAVAAVSFAATVLPAWRAALLSPLVALRNEPESMWQAARLKVQRAVRQISAREAPVVPLDALISEFTSLTRRASSSSEVAEIALATLQERTGAQTALLLEKAAGGEYRSPQCSLPANSILLNRLRHYWPPLNLDPDTFETWKRWAEEFRPEHATEIETLANSGARLAIALRAKNEIVGVLLLGPPKDREQYTAAEKQIFSSSAEVFALMIENARLTGRAIEQERLQRDLELAAEVQRRLLPHEPPAGGAFALAAFSLPARTVGGDYYDFLDLGGERTGIALADISGKGIAAALLMSVVQASLRVIATEGEMPLSELASRMNGFIYRSTATNKYATFFYAQIDQRCRRLRYVNAGHNAPYLVRRSGAGVEITELSAGGTVLGLFPEAQYNDATVDLCSGDLLVAFTDGITEALDSEGQEFGEQRLQDLLRGASGKTAEEISSILAGRVREWIGDAEQHDDLTFVIVAVN
jgi:predicted permease